jgi:hypothetical protein
LKARRDSIPALRRKGREGRKGVEKYLIFCLEGKIRNVNFVVPKAK